MSRLIQNIKDWLGKLPYFISDLGARLSRRPTLTKDGLTAAAGRTMEVFSKPLTSSGEAEQEKTVRGRLNRYGPYVALAAAIIMVICIYSWYGAIVTPRPDPGPPKWGGIWQYDLRSGQLLPDTGDLPSDPANMVRALVYSCGECSDETSHFIGYLEKYGPLPVKNSVEAAGSQPTAPGEMAMTAPAAGPPVNGVDVHLLALPPAETQEAIPDPPHWVAEMDEQAAAILNNPRDHCSPHAATECFPTKARQSERMPSPQ